MLLKVQSRMSRYCGLSLDDQRRMARLGSGTLPGRRCIQARKLLVYPTLAAAATVVQAFAGLKEAEERGGAMTIYSAHDNTIMALLSQLGKPHR